VKRRCFATQPRSDNSERSEAEFTDECASIHVVKYEHVGLKVFFKGVLAFKRFAWDANLMYVQLFSIFIFATCLKEVHI